MTTNFEIPPGVPTYESISGGASNDMLTSGLGNDTIDGDGGIDTLTYSGKREQFTITKTSGNVVVFDSLGIFGNDTLINVERIVFQDYGVAFDVDGNAGKAYRLYQAAFDRKPDLGGLGWQIKAMDSGLDPLQLAQNFMASAEFQTLYGINPSSTTLVNLLYKNVLHRTPQQFETDFWVNILDKGTPVHQTPAEVLLNFSESAENQAQVIGTIQNGIEYQFFA